MAVTKTLRWLIASSVVLSGALAGCDDTSGSDQPTVESVVGHGSFVSQQGAEFCLRIDNKAVDDHDECYDVSSDSDIPDDLEEGESIVYEIVDGDVAIVRRGERLTDL
jgi:hypothetical protein